MTQLTASTLTIPLAVIGPTNPFPPLAGDTSIDKQADLGGASPAIQANASYGRVKTISPYLLQDGYTRERTVGDLRSITLENEHLRATFLPGMGGRLWSLVDMTTGRELLYCNPIFQPANLALRNAWFAGGVEWNIGTIGHTPLTAAPLHAAEVTDDDGNPVLRLYEFERLRRVVYQLDVHLPPGAKELAVHVRVTNPNSEPAPLYWWSNIAVPQTADTRVIASADATWHYSYDSIVRHDPVAPVGGDDISYPARYADAADFFFDVDPGVKRPWIAAIEPSGAGLLQTSTAQLVGRKLFRWGISSGGQRWQEWLSGPIGDAQAGYAEIQAGLAATQFEHIPLPAGETIQWTETYSALQVDPSVVTDSYSSVRAAVAAAVDDTAQLGDITILDSRAREIAARAPRLPLADGSGWGALEQLVRRATGEAALPEEATPFTAHTLGAPQHPWQQLLETGSYPDIAPDQLPISLVAHPGLVQQLVDSPGWAGIALAGAVSATTGDWDAARGYWERSLQRAENTYARRNLAMAAQVAGDTARAAALYQQALADLGLGGARPVDQVALRALVCEALPVLLAAGDASGALRISDSLPVGLARDGRIRMLVARAHVAAGNPDLCAAILADPGLEVADLREGEASLDDLWWDCHTALRAAATDQHVTAALRAAVQQEVPLPAHLDFRMKPLEA